jgi:hypothetical protein
MLKIEAFGSVLRNQSTISLNVHQGLTASGKVTSVTQIRERWVPATSSEANPPPNFLSGPALCGECVERNGFAVGGGGIA